MISTEAWVLHRGESSGVPGNLVRETFSFDDIGPDEVLAKPLLGAGKVTWTTRFAALP